MAKPHQRLSDRAIDDLFQGQGTSMSLWPMARMVRAAYLGHVPPRLQLIVGA